MQDQQTALHPRPQLSRSAWIDLRGEWGFTYDDARRGLDENWQRRHDVFTRVIRVPFPPESSASGIGDQGYHPVVWYRRTFALAPAMRGKRLLLHFGAVDYRAHVWVNGSLVAQHEGGHTPFCADITPALNDEAEQTIVVRAQDEPLDLAQPRGKQDWELEPHVIFYHRTTGIWQPVWLEIVSPDHIQQVRWTPDLDTCQLGLALTLQRSQIRPLRVRIRLSVRGKMLADDTVMVEGTELRRQIGFTIPPDQNELLWSPEYPNLIDAVLTLYDDEQVIDEVRSYAGLRSVGVENGRFLLNGHPYYLRLVLEQGYWPESHLAAPDDDALRREVELVRSLGFNGVRIHQKVEDPRFLYWCDRLGLVTWGEMANCYVFSRPAQERLTREWLEVVERDYSHPCLIAWVPVNESWGIPNLSRDPAQRDYARALYHLTKALDPTRPVMSNEGWEHTISDIVGIHDYSFQGETLRQRYGTPEAIERVLTNTVRPSNNLILLPGYQRREEPVMLTEFGGISYQPQENERWFGYGTVTSAEAYIAKYKELIDAIYSCPQIAGFCYTQLTDTEQERNGLLTEKRVPKFDLAILNTITRGLPIDT